ncbi:MAG: hypothetical protein L6R41_004412 [Letrouitia leprolyta]|nr:MAG: hypothetical protein L6R41_004412 [Letrouitia leprolyta]
MSEPMKVLLIKAQRQSASIYPSTPPESFHGYSLCVRICFLPSMMPLPLFVNMLLAYAVASADPPLPSKDIHQSLGLQDDPRFSTDITMSETKLPPTPVLMSAVELSARYAEMNYLGGVPRRQGIVLPQFPQVEIAVIPAAPARTVEVRLIILAIYDTILDMIYGKRFNESEVEVKWENQVKAYMYITPPLDDERRASGNFTNIEITNSSEKEIPPPLQADTNDTPNPIFDWKPIYKPAGANLFPNDVFLLALGAIKVVAPNSATEQVTGPFHVGSDLVDANLQVYTQDRRLARPPYLRYGQVLEAVRRIPGWQLERRRFAEFFCSIEVSRKSIGVVLLEKGQYEPHGVMGAAGGNVSIS